MRPSVLFKIRHTEVPVGTECWYAHYKTPFEIVARQEGEFPMTILMNRYGSIRLTGDFHLHTEKTSQGLAIKSLLNPSEV